MNENQENAVSYLAHESDMVRMERIIKRLSVAIIIMMIIIFLNNALWLYTWMQYDYSGTETQTTAETKTITVDGKDGTANYIGNDGDITNGEDSNKDNENENPNKNP